MKPSALLILLLIIGWGAAATLVLLSGIPSHTAPGVIPAIVFILAAALIVALGRVPTLRNAMATVPTPWLIGFHGFRLIGGSFLWYAAQGRLPALFANAAGWGDVATAVGALSLLAFRQRVSRGLLWAWNAFGTLDLFVAVGTAGLLTFQGASMIEMTHLPLGLIPLWAVPLMLAGHAELFRRVRRWSADQAPRYVSPATFESKLT